MKLKHRDQLNDVVALAHKHILIEREGKGLKLVYLSGKITGLTPAEFVKNFKTASAYASANQIGSPLNPTLYIDESCEWELAMRFCIAVLPLCDVMLMQPNWQESRGAIHEHVLAEKLGLKILYMD